MQLKTPMEFVDYIERILPEIDTGEFSDETVREFIEHHVMFLAVNVSSIKYLLTSEEASTEETIKYGMYLNMYGDIEKRLSGRLNEFSTEELYNKIIGCKEIVSKHVESKNT